MFFLFSVYHINFFLFAEQTLLDIEKLGIEERGVKGRDSEERNRKEQWNNCSLNDEINQTNYISIWFAVLKHNLINPTHPDKYPPNVHIRIHMFAR